MQAKLTINGVDFTPFVVEGGIEQTDIDRKSVSVVTLDGRLWERTKTARVINVSMRILRDKYYTKAMTALTANPAMVTYTDKDTGSNVTKSMYIKNRRAGIKRVRGGNTYWHNAGFTLEAVI